MSSITISYYLFCCIFCPWDIKLPTIGIFFNLMKYVSFEILWKFRNFLKILKYWKKFEKFLIYIFIYFWKFSILNFFENLDFLKNFQFYYPLPIIINIYWTPSLPMVFWPPYPWYIDPPTHGISTPPTHGIIYNLFKNWTYSLTVSNVFKIHKFWN